jgi:hypothetical protein
MPRLAIKNLLLPPFIKHMEYREIVAVTGLGGLFQLLATKSDGAIVRNLTDKSIKFIPARVHNVTPIESIEIYTVGDNVRLHKVLQAMKDQESSTAPLDTKKADNNAIKAYFSAVYPDMDEQRVYVSDMKKILKWYELLKENDLLNFEALEQEEAEMEAGETMEEAPAASEEEEAKPAKKARAKKADEAEAAEATEEEAKPAKKARSKKADEPAAEGEEKPAKKTAARKKKTEE